MSTAQTDASRIAEAGRLLYGERWQSPLARVSGLSQALLSAIVAGDRPLTDDAKTKIAEALVVEAKRLRVTAGKLDRLHGLLVAR